jgi:hypothetical protein
MHGINWKLTGTILFVGALAFLVYDITQGAFDKTKLAAAGWTAKA